MKNEYKQTVTEAQDFLNVKVSGRCESKIDGNFQHVFVLVGNEDGEGIEMKGTINASSAFLFQTLENIVEELAERGIEAGAMPRVIVVVQHAVNAGIKRAIESTKKDCEKVPTGEKRVRAGTSSNSGGRGVTAATGT